MRTWISSQCRNWHRSFQLKLFHTPFGKHESEFLPNVSWQASYCSSLHFNSVSFFLLQSWLHLFYGYNFIEVAVAALHQRPVKRLISFSGWVAGWPANRFAEVRRTKSKIGSLIKYFLTFFPLFLRQQYTSSFCALHRFLGHHLCSAMSLLYYFLPFSLLELQFLL